jgi:hypothetical protein
LIKRPVKFMLLKNQFLQLQKYLFQENVVL